MEGYNWMNECKMTELDGKIVMEIPDECDFFYNTGVTDGEGIVPGSYNNAPFYYLEATGDFVYRAHVSHDFVGTYDSCVLLVMKDIENWGKLCFEHTDFGTQAVVSVISRDRDCDDANGCNISEKDVWLQISRVNNTFAFHFSEDGKNFFMTRCYNMDCPETVKVGICGTAPQGKGGKRMFENITFENRTVKNIRFGE